MSSIKRYFETHAIETEECAKQYPVITYKLSGWLAKEKQYEQSLQSAEAGIECCIEKGELSFFPELVYKKGCILILMGKEAEGRQCLMQANTILSAMKAEDRVISLKKEVEESLGKEFFIC